MAILTFTLLAVLSIFSGCDAFCGCIGLDWTPMDGVGCFKFFEEHKTFIEAQEHCRWLSPRQDTIVNLASVHSEEEYNLLKAMVPPPINGWDPQVFIGLRLKDGVTPAWTDGSFYDYQNWCGNDPNAHPGGYGAISGGDYCLGLWVDVHTFTNDQFPYICKSQCLDELGNTIA